MQPVLQRLPHRRQARQQGEAPLASLAGAASLLSSLASPVSTASHHHNIATAAANGQAGACICTIQKKHSCTNSQPPSPRVTPPSIAVVAQPSELMSLCCTIRARNCPKSVCHSCFGWQQRAIMSHLQVGASNCPPWQDEVGRLCSSNIHGLAPMTSWHRAAPAVPHLGWWVHVGVLQNDVRPHSWPRALQCVPICVPAELPKCVQGNVVTQVSQGWVPRGCCKHPLQDLACACVVPAGRGPFWPEWAAL